MITGVTNPPRTLTKVSFMLLFPRKDFHHVDVDYTDRTKRTLPSRLD